MSGMRRTSPIPMPHADKNRGLTVFTKLRSQADCFADGLVEYVALASANNVTGFYAGSTQFGVPYIEFTASEAARGQIASFRGGTYELYIPHQKRPSSVSPAVFSAYCKHPAKVPIQWTDERLLPADFQIYVTTIHIFASLYPRLTSKEEHTGR